MRSCIEDAAKDSSYSDYDQMVSLCANIAIFTLIMLLRALSAWFERRESHGHGEVFCILEECLLLMISSFSRKDHGI